MHKQRVAIMYIRHLMSRMKMKSLKIGNWLKKEIKWQAFEIFSKMNSEKQWNYEKISAQKVEKNNEEQYHNFYYNVAEQLEIEDTELDSSHFDETGHWW